MRRAVLMVIDGLRADMVSPELTPNLCEIAAGGRFFPRQSSVFPSATRISSASIASGCYPSSHGLAGNTIALDEGSGLSAVSVGPVEFRERWRKATGRTLLRPTLTEHLAEHGGVSIYSNSSPGAAHMQDPDGFGWLRHRSGSHAPGFRALEGADHLDVTYDADGDRITIERFCSALDTERDHPVHITWICEPDHSQHVLELGSPEHRAILAGADLCAAEVATAVRRQRERGDDVLFVLASDHGHETVDGIVPVLDLLVEAGLKAAHDSSDVVVASSGMGALLYLSDEAADREAAIAARLRSQPWCGPVFTGEALDGAHVPRDAHLRIAFSMAKRDAVNPHGVRGYGWVAADEFSRSDQFGHGQHGGLGPYETNPMLIIEGSGFEPGVSTHQSRVIDIAPTILRHLDVPPAGMDGEALPER